MFAYATDPQKLSTAGPVVASSSTLMRFTVHGEPSGPMRLMQPLLRRALRRQLRQDCATLKSVLERERQPA